MTSVKRKDESFIKGMISGKENCAWIGLNHTKYTNTLSRRDIRAAVTFKCPFLGIKLQYWQEGPDKAILTRIDKHGKYVPGNIITISTAASQGEMI